MSGPSQVHSIACTHCGAPLPPSEVSRAVLCTYCGSHLEIFRDDQRDNQAERSSQIEQDVHELKRQRELEELDRVWMMRRAEFMLNNRGRVRAPNMAGAFIGMIFAVVFAMFWIAMAISHGAPFVFPVMGLFFIGGVIFSGVSRINKAEEYAREEQRYQQNRRVILSRRNDAGL